MSLNVPETAVLEAVRKLTTRDGQAINIEAVSRRCGLTTEQVSTYSRALVVGRLVEQEHGSLTLTAAGREAEAA